MRLRREQVLSMLMNGLTEGQIGRRLGISQASVSRDLKRLDDDAEKLAVDLARVELADNAIWRLFFQLDEAVAQTLKGFDGSKHVDPESRLTELRLLLDLLYKKCYLLRFVGLQAESPSLSSSLAQTLTEQYWQLGVRFSILEERLNGKVELAKRALG